MAGYVILGNGVAGTTAAEAIRKLDKDNPITILTDENTPFYYRLRLNEFVAGELPREELIAKKEAWYREHRIDLRLTTPVETGDPAARRVTAKNGEVFIYGRLLVATGSRSFIPPIKGSDRQGVFALRSMEDARSLSAAAEKSRKVVLIGGGLLGLEAGNALRKRGLEVMVVEFFPRLLPRQLDVEGARRLQVMMERMGFRFRLGAKTQEIGGDTRIERVILEGGESLQADMVVISAGVRPNMEIARSLGLETDKGIKVDQHLRTNQEGIYAAGDVAQFGAMPYGIWPAAQEQGRIAGVNMAGGEERYDGTTMANLLKVVGVDLASAGEIDAEGKFESRVQAEENLYKKLVFDKGKIIGCIMLGNKRGFNQVTKWMQEGRDVSAHKDAILTEGFDFKII